MAVVLCLLLSLLVFSACSDSSSDNNVVDGDSDGDPVSDGDGEGEEDGDADGLEDGDEETDGDGDGDPEEESDPQIVSDSFSVRGTVEQVYVWNAEPQTAFEILDAGGGVVAEGTLDEWGGWVARELEPGDGYVVRLKDDPQDFTDQIRVWPEENDPPDESFYTDQVLEPGFGYITMRDGTKLSAFISLPGPPEDGPYPTLVNYSGYSPSRPGESLGGVAELFCEDFPVLCDAPSHPSGIIAGVLGYATVGVNLRGTGCSGGAYDYFEPLQLQDGYDVIETVAHQSWAKFNKVGMVGLSYPGITQLFTASTRPPSLAAIAPFSVIADTATSTLVPGGIYNNGFALEWIDMVLDKAEPYAHGWITALVEAGDTVCEENQMLHHQKLDAIEKALENPYYTDEVAAPLDPTAFAHKIEVPVFLTGQCQDEQTGPHFPALFDRFVNSPLRRFTITNGVHPDGFAPQILGEWMNFLSFHIRKEIPSLEDNVKNLVPLVMVEIFGSEGLSVPPQRFTEYDDFETALADYEAEDEVRVIFDSGAHPSVKPGAPRGTFEDTFPEWPIPSIEPWRLYLTPEGDLSENTPEAGGGYCSFEHDPEAGQRVFLNSGAIEVPQPDYAWRQPDPGKAASFLSDTLDGDQALIGPASIDLWVRSTADDADLEVTVTEVREDGLESFVQSGRLRASHRALRDDATDLRPTHTHREEDIAPLVADEWNPLRIEMMPISHVFREGSRIRVVIDTPGDSCGRWRFLLLDYDTPPVHSIAHDADHPSSVLLPLVPGIEAPTDQPDCTAMRGQPCREYQAYENVVGPE